MAIKAIAFDLDGTLTQHRSPVPEEHIEILRKLQKKYKLLMVGAGTCERIYKQMGNFPITIVGNYGMMQSEIVDGAFKMVKNITAPCDKESIEARVKTLREKYGYTEFAGRSVEFHPSGAVTIPLLGTDAKIEDKVVFDPDKKKRHAIYDEVKEMFSEYTVFVGGSSSFDMTPAPYEKAYALRTYAAENGLDISEVVFVGDDFGPGGGDESVLKAGMNVIMISDYREFPDKLKEYYN